MLALDPAQDRQKIVPRCDRNLPPEQQTRFVCRPLTVFEDAQVADMTGFAQGKIALNLQQKNVLAFRLGVVAVENLQDVDGKSVELERVPSEWGLVLSDAFLSRIHPAVVREIGEAVREMSNPTEAELGN